MNMAVSWELAFEKDIMAILPFCVFEAIGGV